MTNIEIRKNKTGFTVKAEGHAGYDEYGKDIVCASISMLCYTLSECIHDGAVMEKSGEFYLTCQGADEEDWQRLRVITEGFRLLANNYSKNVNLNIIE